MIIKYTKESMGSLRDASMMGQAFVAPLGLLRQNVLGQHLERLNLVQAGNVLKEVALRLIFSYTFLSCASLAATCASTGLRIAMAACF